MSRLSFPPSRRAIVDSFAFNAFLFFLPPHSLSLTLALSFSRSPADCTLRTAAEERPTLQPLPAEQEEEEEARRKQAAEKRWKRSSSSLEQTLMAVAGRGVAAVGLSAVVLPGSTAAVAAVAHAETVAAGPSRNRRCHCQSRRPAGAGAAKTKTSFFCSSFFRFVSLFSVLLCSRSLPSRP